MQGKENSLITIKAYPSLAQNNFSQATIVLEKLRKGLAVGTAAGKGDIFFPNLTFHNPGDNSLPQIHTFTEFMQAN